MLALAFTLAVVALVAFLIVSSITTSNTRVALDPAKLRGFKKDELTAQVVLSFKRPRWANVNLSAIRAQPGVEIRLELTGGDAKVFISSKYAGCFSGLIFELEARDILNLFSKRIQTIYSDFTYDSLPLSILAPIPHTKPMPLAFGERSGRSPGSSLELYALEDYKPYTETKNVMWKKVARMPDERLIVRIRDSSIPVTVRIGLVQAKIRRGEDKLRLMDLVCEAAGMIGNSLLAAGCSLEIIHTSQENRNPIAVHEVSDLDELSDALMHLSDAPKLTNTMEYQFEILARSDFVICGLREMEQQELALAISKKPTVAIAEQGASPVVAGQHTMIYTGSEDVRKLVSKILEI